MAFNWYKDGLRVLPTPRVQIRGPVIEIADVTYEDSGVYVCVLRGHKEPTRNFTITVAGEERTVKLRRFGHKFSFVMNFIKIYSPESFVTSPDSVGSGDDDEDNDLQDSSAEIENDQVYISKGP